MINRQIEIVDNRKMKITYDLMIWSMIYNIYIYNRHHTGAGTES